MTAVAIVMAGALGGIAGSTIFRSQDAPVSSSSSPELITRSLTPNRNIYLECGMFNFSTL